jgi:hypothetical protein
MHDRGENVGVPDLETELLDEAHALLDTWKVTSADRPDLERTLTQVGYEVVETKLLVPTEPFVGVRARRN